MAILSTARLGTSCSFLRTIDRNMLRAVHDNGIDAVELIWSDTRYADVLNDPQAIDHIRTMAAEESVELWSLHLPFSEVLDISSENREQREHILTDNLRFIRFGAAVGVKTIVLHPSSEPISDKERPHRLALSREAIILLNKACLEAGLTLAVENLPRTCLCNRSAEMIELLRGTGTAVCFDFNHSLCEDNVSFLTALIDSGLTIATVHISDYDLVNERHRLPGDGCNDWNRLLGILEAADYRGPLMYEVVRQPYQREEISLIELADNMQKLREKAI